MPEPRPPRELEGGRRRPEGVEWVLVAAALLFAAVLLLGPILALLRGSLSEGVSRLLREVSARDALHALQLTLLLGAGATLLNTLFGVCTALVLVRHDFRGRRWLNGLVDLPFAVSPVIAGFMFILLFGRGGWFSPLAESLGIKVVFALPGMLLATAFVSLPFVTREVMPVLQQRGIEAELTAYTLGASPWRTFWSVTLPGIRWGLLYGVSLTFARALGEFGAVLVVSGGISGLTETTTLYIFHALDARNPVGAYAMALALALLSFGLLTAMEFVRRRSRAGDGAP
jgi:sulfate transport system permease protein